MAIAARATRYFAPVVFLALCAAASANEQQPLFLVDSTGRVLRADGGGKVTVIAQGLSSVPDGIAFDSVDRHVYWTNMGKAGANDGSITRADYDGKNVRTIVAAGDTFTPKQLKIDLVNSKLYWADREGMRIMRANLDGSYIETLVETGKSEQDRQDQKRWCVGIALDIPGNKIYWTQQGGENANEGTLRRASLELPSGEDPAERSDVEVLVAGLPEPSALEVDLNKRLIYWIDRDGAAISRIPMDPKKPFDPTKRTDREQFVAGLHDVIGIALDTTGNRLYYTTSRGRLGAVDLNGKQVTEVLSGQGSLTGIALAE